MNITHISLLILLQFSSLVVRGETNFELRNGRKMPAVGLGTWQANNEQELMDALDVAIDTGYRYIDTAFTYYNEPFIGKTLKKWFDSGKLNRNDIFITSKLPYIGMKPEKVQRFINKTLTDLQLDYIDMYLIHVPFAAKEKPEFYGPLLDKDGNRVVELETDHIALWKEMEKLVDSGLVKSIGLSNFNQSQIEKILKNSRIPPANLQIEHHLYLQQKDLIDFCKGNQIIVTAYSPLGSPGSAKLGLNVPNLLSHPTVTKIAENHNKTTAQVLIRHIIQKGIVAIPKSVHELKIRQNFDVFDFELTEDELQQLNGLDKNTRLFTFLKFSKGLDTHPEYPFTNEIKNN